jgi:hypothetical protein
MARARCCSVRRDAYGVALREGQETPSLAQIADWWSASPTTTCWTMVGPLSPLDRSRGRSDTPAVAVAEGGGDRPGSGGRWRVRSAHGGAILQGWFSENWSVCPALSLQITNKCLLSPFVDVCARRVNHSTWLTPALTWSPLHGAVCPATFTEGLTLQEGAQSNAVHSVPSGIDSTALQPHGGNFLCPFSTWSR